MKRDEFDAISSLISTTISEIDSHMLRLLDEQPVPFTWEMHSRQNLRASCIIQVQLGSQLEKRHALWWCATPNAPLELISKSPLVVRVEFLAQFHMFALAFKKHRGCVIEALKGPWPLHVDVGAKELGLPRKDISKPKDPK